MGADWRAVPKPPQIAKLPTNRVGYPIPWFVDRTADSPEGDPDFRVADNRKLLDARRFSRCWVCGQPRGRWGSFVVGPMCAINRTSAEPPCHAECAVYSARVCPFLITPRMVRRESGTEGYAEPAGIMLRRNPGVTLVYPSRSFSWYRAHAGNGGMVYDLGDPVGATWWAEGRPATLAEVVESITTGLPALQDVARAEGPLAVIELGRLHAAFATELEATFDASTAKAQRLMQAAA